MTLSTKKNRGEWSELFVLVNLLATGNLQFGQNDTSSESFPVISVARTIAGLEHKFTVRDGFIEVEKEEFAQESWQISQETLIKRADILFTQIKQGTGRTFVVPCAIEIMSELGIEKATGMRGKDDLKITIYDPRTKQKTSQGFSIKSFIGSNPSVLNASGVTNIEFTINRKPSQYETETLNKCGPIELVSTLLQSGYALSLSNIDERFADNLEMIDSEMPELVSQMVLASYSGEGRTMVDIVKILTMKNPMKYSTHIAEKRYTHKAKDLLEAVALGMRPSDEWRGHQEASGGNLIVTSTGQILCHHALDKDSLRNYLFNNCYFDTPSRKKWKFGTIVEDKINLNFQIRVKK